MPDLPLVRIQEHRGFESPGSAHDKNSFERRRRTAGNLSLVNDATDQKIPPIIHSIDEREEFNLKGSISSDNEAYVASGERILV